MEALSPDEATLHITMDFAGCFLGITTLFDCPGPYFLSANSKKADVSQYPVCQIDDLIASRFLYPHLGEKVSSILFFERQKFHLKLPSQIYSFVTSVVTGFYNRSVFAVSFLV